MSSRRLSSRATRPPRGKAVGPVVGVVLLVGLTLLLAAVLVVTLPAVGPGGESTSDAAFDLSVDASSGAVAIQHMGGDPVDVRDLSVHVTVEGAALEDQPPVPFFAAHGFGGGPEGPFNERADPEWTVGETASVRVANTNDPTIDPGDVVRVTLAVDGRQLATLETTAA